MNHRGHDSDSIRHESGEKGALTTAISSSLMLKERQTTAQSIDATWTKPWLKTRRLFRELIIANKQYEYSYEQMSHAVVDADKKRLALSDLQLQMHHYEQAHDRLKKAIIHMLVFGETWLLSPDQEERAAEMIVLGIRMPGDEISMLDKQHVQVLRTIGWLTRALRRSDGVVDC